MDPKLTYLPHAHVLRGIFQDFRFRSVRQEFPKRFPASQDSGRVPTLANPKFGPAQGHTILRIGLGWASIRAGWGKSSSKTNLTKIADRRCQSFCAVLTVLSIYLHFRLYIPLPR